MLYNQVPTPTGQDFTVARASDVTRTNEDGFLEVIGSNVPCIDYSDGFPVLLTQPQSTNLITYSSAFDNAYWTKSNISAVSGQSSPDGLTNAFKLVENSALSTHQLVAASFITVTNGIDYDLNIYVKAGERYKFGVREAATTGLYATFDLNAEIVLAQNGTNATIKSLNNGWYRITFNSISGSTNFQPIFHILSDSYTSGAPSVSYQGDGASGLYIWGAQLEQLSYPTSYIPTTGATATRLADVVTGAGSTSSINSEVGSFKVTIKALVDDLSNRTISINDGTAANGITIGYNGTTNTILSEYLIAGVASASLSYQVADITNFVDVEFTYAVNDFELFIDEVSRGTDVSGAVVAASTFNSVDFNDGGGTNSFLGRTKILIVE